jgi:uncharacterized membrane protein YdbT with pleckstrin-like domain
MSYLQKVLQPGETILYRTTFSWTLYIPGLLVLLLAIAVFAISDRVLTSQLWAYILALILAFVALALLAKAWFRRWTTEIAITNRRIILKRGFIRRHTIEINMDKVESVDVDQSLLGRLLNYGDITVRGTGEGFERLRMIDAPLKFRSQVSAS